MSRADEFREYADWASDHSRLYERLSRASAGDEALLALVEAVPSTQPAPQLLLGAVHDLLLAGVDSPLAAFYPTCTDAPLDPDSTDPVPRFKEFCLRNEAPIRDRLESRLVQTNEVGRSAVLYPSLSRVASRAGEPLALIEIGASAGLNLRWNRYRYEYDDRAVGIESSPVTIESTFRGEPPRHLPVTPPTVRWSVGIDLNPLDVTDPDAARWLRALVLPSQTRRHERLEAAIDLAADDPPDVVQGDASEDLTALIERAPTDATRCVFSTLTIYQISDESIGSIRETLADHSSDGPVHWLSGDPEADASDLTYRHVRFSDGEITTERLARFEAYGSWIEWRADEGRRSDY